MSVNIQKWLDENKDSFLPPVCNKLLYNTQLKAFYVGGPNSRSDFHLEAGEEFFYMRKGDMNLPIVEKGILRDIHIKEGDIFLLPSRIPHSPQRKENTIGLVIERERHQDELDSFRWHVDNSLDILYEKWFHCDDLGTQLAPIFKEYFASEQYKTGKPIPGTISDNPPIKYNANIQVRNPFNLKLWIKKYREELDNKGQKLVFDKEFQTQVIIYGQGQNEGYNDDCDTFLWQLEGSAVIVVDGASYNLTEDSNILILAKQRYVATRSAGSLTLGLVMDSCKKTIN